MKKLIRCIVAEDEDEPRQWLVTHLRTFEDIEVLAETVGVDDTFKALLYHRPDAAFLDIKLIGGDAFEILDRLQRSGVPLPYIVFTSAFHEYASVALNDFRSKVVHFLVKPIRQDWETKLRRSIDALIVALHSDTSEENLPENIGDKSVNNVEESVFIKHKNQFQKIHFAEIAYLESAGSGLTYIVLDTTTMKVDVSILQLLENKFPSNFVRISKANAVNKNRIINIDRKNHKVEILLADKSKFLPIGKNYYADLVKLLC